MSSLFGRALAGAGSAVSEIANKYIDAEIANSRAQVLADIQRNSAVQQNQQIDEYNLSDSRQERLRSATTAATIAGAGATDQAQLNTMSNQPLMDATITRTNAVTKGTAQATADAAGLLKTAQERAMPIKTNPGDQVYDADGKLIVENTRLTAGELNMKAFREGLKGKNKEERDRAYEITLTGVNQQIKEISTVIDKGVADGTLALKPNPDETHLFGANTPGKPNEAHERYQELVKKQRLLEKQRNDIAAEYRSMLGKGDRTGGSDGGKADPLGLGIGGNDAAGADPRMGKRLPGDTSDTPAIMRTEAARLLRELDNPDLSDTDRTKLEGELSRVAQEPGVDLSQLKPTPPAGSLMGGRGKVNPTLPSEAPANAVKAAAAPAAAGSAGALIAAQEADDNKPGLMRRAVKAVGGALSERTAIAEKTRNDFDTDMKTLPPKAFVEKYAGLRHLLSSDQYVRLGRVEASI